jgi:D-alanyl-D-alanine carboxypeptidase
LCYNSPVQAHPRHLAPRRRDPRPAIVFAVLLIGVLAWVAVGPLALGRQAAASPVAATTPSPTPTPIPTPTPTAPPLPACAIADVPAVHRQFSDWAETMLDTTYMVDSSYEPADLVSVAEAGIGGAGLIRSFVIPDLAEMYKAARADGIIPKVNSAYRSFKDQGDTFTATKKSLGSDYALASVARAGHSEHQLGTAIDFGGAAGAWLAVHAWKYGFIGSYPADLSPGFTCYKAEAWHYRYFGRETAAAIHGSGLSAREWLWINAR